MLDNAPTLRVVVCDATGALAALVPQLNGAALSVVTSTTNDLDALQAAADFDVVVVPWHVVDDTVQLTTWSLQCAVVVVADDFRRDDPAVAFEAGADDFVLLPVGARELRARLKSAARRLKRFRRAARPVLSADKRLQLHPEASTVTVRGQEVQLTSHEFALLSTLMRAEGDVLSREEIVDAVTGDIEGVFDRSVDVRISRLRHKLEENPRRPQLIRTVRGRGYRFVADELHDHRG